MKMAGLFAGIGGLELGLHASGHETLLFCENDPAAAAVLNERFPGIPIRSDVRDLEQLPPDTEMVTAGFPCQDLSQAGRTRGIRGSRSGLVGEVFRLLEKHDVPHLLLENVPFMLQLDKGKAVCWLVDRLEELGFHWAYRVVDSRAFGLPQRRQRVFMLASRNGVPRHALFRDSFPVEERTDFRDHACGFYWTEGKRGLGWAVDAVPTLKGGSTIGIPSPPAVWMPDGRIVTPHIRDAERLQGFSPGWTEPAERVGRAGFRWRLVGNAVSVPAAEWIGTILAEEAAPPPEDAHEFCERKSWPKAAFGSPGEDRLAVDVTTFPMQRSRPPLTRFLEEEPKPLSRRAVAGFLSRLQSGRLRYPPEFLEALQDHLEWMSNESVRETA